MNMEADPIGTVVVIETATNTIAKIIEVENYPTGIATNAK